MKTKKTTGSKEQEMQSTQNKRQADNNSDAAGYDKKLDGPNRPSV
ncbi:hypothetical protein ACFQ88_28525 [Paenibacillus sp. NPDC056579]|nr:hypothetical protein [Paenibacillus sp. H1-7]